MRLLPLLVGLGLCGCEAATEPPCDTSKLCCCAGDRYGPSTCSDGKATCGASERPVACDDVVTVCRSGGSSDAASGD